MMKSRCTYCGSADYGKGCSFGPHKTHFHASNGKKCAYCGSGSFGRGCRLNPTSDLHIHGINYNTMFKEQVQSFLDSKLLLRELKKDFKEYECYKQGVIDEHGNKIKSPLTEEEKLSFSPMTRMLIRLKKYIGQKLDLIDNSEVLSGETALYNEDILYYRKLLIHQNNINKLINQLYETLDEAQTDGISFEDIQKLIRA